MVEHAQPRDLLDPHGLRVRPHRASTNELVHRLEALLLLLGSPVANRRSIRRNLKGAVVHRVCHALAILLAVSSSRTYKRKIVSRQSKEIISASF